MRRILNGLTALTGMAAALLGLPWLLVNVGNALADLIPDWSQLPTELLSPGDGGLFLGMVLLVGWVCWATFVIAFIVELAARARGVSAPSLGRFFPQVTAARAVTAVVVMFATVTPQVAQATPATAIPVTAAPVAATAPAREGSVPTGKHYERYTVERGDTLWEISGDELGDPQRYPEIYRASKTIEQPDGQHLTDPNLIRPGWKLHIPVAKARKKATAPTPATPTPAPTRASNPEPQSPAPHPVATPTPETPLPEGDSTGRLPGSPLVPTTSTRTQLDTPLIIDDHQTDAIVDTPLKPVLTGLPEWITTPLIPVPRD